MSGEQIHNIMKLELKHLAPYLPYELKCQYIDTPNEVYIVPMNVLGIDFITDNESDYDFNSIKPILRPLPDLTCDDLGMMFGIANGTVSSFEFVRSFEEDWYLEYKLFGVSHLGSCIAGWNQVQAILKDKYDVFGLIEKGLAIDINTLK